MTLSKTEKKTLNALLHQILELRDRACLRCGKPDFQMSHIYPKGRYRSMEFDPDNVKALCYSCHLHWWHKNPIEAKEWLDTVMPKKRLERLKLASQTRGGRFDYKLHKLFLEQEIKKLKSAS